MVEVTVIKIHETNILLTLVFVLIKQLFQLTKL